MVKQVQFKTMDGRIETDMIHVKKLTVKPETDTSSETTFTGTLSSTTFKGFSIEIERLGIMTKDDYMKLQQIMETALTTGIQITTKETVTLGNETFDEIFHYFDCTGADPEKTTNPGNEYSSEKYTFSSPRRENGTV
ncbi:MAG: hypothetical protein IKF11_05845 [Methanobrevibacter sp.]|nr:hypothetical protein [Methanobrevibacter sp.]